MESLLVIGAFAAVIGAVLAFDWWFAGRRKKRLSEYAKDPSSYDPKAAPRVDPDSTRQHQQRDPGTYNI